MSRVVLKTLQPGTGSDDAFDERVRTASGKPLAGLSIETVQVNIGLRCNLACHHCHVESSPKRTEQMSWSTMRMVLDAADRAGASTLDITGGAPEMHPFFAAFIDAAIVQGLRVMVRTNLTIMLQPGYEHLPAWFADKGVHLIASLPCYLESNVDAQRGKHVYRESVAVIQSLNERGYGLDEDKQLDLIYNPGGPDLPPAQQELEETYRRELLQAFGIRFHHLYTITNVPIGRFLHDLQRDDQAESYSRMLQEAFNPQTLDGLMCRRQLHIGWDGSLFDCDFNYAIGLQTTGRIRHLRDFEPRSFLQRQITTGKHCFACTAGSGSSCTGVLT